MTIDDEFIDALFADMERLGQRPYAEIGVPMFLVAEDLSQEQSTTAKKRGEPELALLFAQAAEALQRRKPDIGPSDVARLVEVMADRYFLALATPPFSRMADLHPENQ